MNDPHTAQRSYLPYVILLSVIVWVAAFFPFVIGEMPLQSDAFSYYEHTKFFVENLTRGVYPLWDAHWNNGVSNEFFLRRIGPFNPFHLVSLTLASLGVTFHVAYRIFLSVYFIVGALGFFLLADRLLKHREAAFVAFLLFLFSSLGMRSFDSYLQLVFVPTIWFFYFLVSFYERPSRYNVLGLVFTLTQLGTTYIPFYFVVILGVFGVCALVFGFRQIPVCAQKVFGFAKGQKLFLIFCAFVLVVSLLPSVKLYQQASSGQLSLPRRHMKSEIDHQLGVPKRDVVRWAVVEDIFYAQYFTENLRKFRFAVLYCSIFIFLVLMLGIFSQLNKLLLFLVVWGGTLFMIASPKNTGIYHWLFENIFFFQFFRNLHFFLWFAIIPIVILFLSEQYRQLVVWWDRREGKRVLSLLFVLGVHLGVLAFLKERGTAIVTSYVTVSLSLLFFVLRWAGVLKSHSPWTWLLLLAALSAEPFEVFSVHLVNNSPKMLYGTLYDRPFFDFSYRRGSPTTFDVTQEEDGFYEPAPITIYVGTRWFNNLNSRMNNKLLNNYLTVRIFAVDQVRELPQAPDDIQALGEAFLGRLNVAYVETAVDADPERPLNGTAEVFDQDSDRLKVLHFDANTLTLRTNFEKKKFLVVNDCFYPGWTARVSGRLQKLYRTNIAFKGFWVPSGDQIVELRYRDKTAVGLELLAMALSCGIFVVLVLGARKREGGPDEQ